MFGEEKKKLDNRFFWRMRKSTAVDVRAYLKEDMEDLHGLILRFLH